MHLLFYSLLHVHSIAAIRMGCIKKLRQHPEQLLKMKNLFLKAVILFFKMHNQASAKQLNWQHIRSILIAELSFGKITNAMCLKLFSRSAIHSLTIGWNADWINIMQQNG